MSVIYVCGSGWNGAESKYCLVFENKTPIIYVSTINSGFYVMTYYSIVKALESCNVGDVIVVYDDFVVGQIFNRIRTKSKILKPLNELTKLLLINS